MPITALPTPPQRSDPVNFAARADAFFAALPTFVAEFNALVPTAVAGYVTGSLTVTGSVGAGAAPIAGIRLTASQTSNDAYDGATQSSVSVFFTKGTNVSITNPISGTAKPGKASLLDFNVTDDNGGDGAYIGGLAQSAGNSSALLVFGRRTGVSSWAESMRINTAGDQLLGTTAAQNARLVVEAKSGGFVMQGTNGGTVTSQVAANGNLTNTNNSYGAISDSKLKENIADASPKLADLMRVRVRSYNLKTDPSHRQIGVVAQELEEVFPGLVEETDDYITVTRTREVDVPAVLDDQGNEVTPASTRTEGYTEQEATGTVTKSVKYSVFVPMLIKAMQEQQALIDVLTARVAALEAP